MGRLCVVITLTSVLCPGGPVTMSLSHSSGSERQLREIRLCVYEIL